MSDSDKKLQHNCRKTHIFNTPHTVAVCGILLHMRNTYIHTSIKSIRQGLLCHIFLIFFFEIKNNNECSNTATSAFGIIVSHVLPSFLVTLKRWMNLH